MKGKTNAMRLLDAADIKYKALEYFPDESDLSGVHVADQIGVPRDRVFKTLVAVGDKTGPVVFVIPCDMELDLKKCAEVSKNKRVELLSVKELLGLTGYIRGGCSPVGMKKRFLTYFDETAELFDEITVSAGIKGCQLLLKSEDVIKFTAASCFDLTQV